jgi:dephospho-CoA kinase
MSVPARRLVVGVTGGIGSGKTAATDFLAELGITVVDADLAARVIMEPGRPALAAVVERFGADILLTDGQLNRARLRSLVFEDPAERKWLEQLTHPLIGKEIIDQLAASQSSYTVLASPLLLETTQKELCDLTVVIDVPESVQLERTMARDNNDEAQVRRIMAAQLPREERLRRADRIIDNSGSLEGLQAQLGELHRDLLALSS